MEAHLKWLAQRAIVQLGCIYKSCILEKCKGTKI